jgi:predicted RNA-binding Zn-ribbon protein involved in translation (DUF1610 family)
MEFTDNLPNITQMSNKQQQEIFYFAESHGGSIPVAFSQIKIVDGEPVWSVTTKKPNTMEQKSNHELDFIERQMGTLVCKKCGVKNKMIFRKKAMTPPLMDFSLFPSANPQTITYTIDKSHKTHYECSNCGTENIEHFILPLHRITHQ